MSWAENSSSSSDSKGSLATAYNTTSSAKEADEESSMDVELDFTLHLGNEKTPRPKKSSNFSFKVLDEQPMVDLKLNLSTGCTVSGVTAIHLSSGLPQNVAKTPLVGSIFHMDEGSKSSSWRSGTSFHPLQTSQNTASGYFLNQTTKEIRLSADPSMSIITERKSSVTCTSGITWQHDGSTETCQFVGCVKGARGASGLCIAHRGGPSCQKPGYPKELREELRSARLTVVVDDVNSLGALKVQKGALITVLHMVAAAFVLLEGNLNCAFDMVEGRDVKRKTAQRVQRAFLVYVFHMEEVADASFQLAQKVLKEVQCFVRQMVVVNSAHVKGTEGSTLFCKGHGGGKRCSFQGGGVCPNSVHGGTLFCVDMMVVKGVLCESARKVQGGELIFVSIIVGARDANWKGVEKVHRGAQIFARPMEEGRVALGAIPLQNLARALALVAHLLEGRPGHAHLMVPWCWRNGFMEVLHWELWFRIWNLENLRKRKISLLMMR